MKNVLKLALGAILLSAGFAFAQTVFRGDLNLIDDPNGTSQFQVGGVDVYQSMTFYVDSLSADITVAVFTPPRNIRVVQMDLYTSTDMATDTSTVSILSTGNTFLGYLPTGDSYSTNNNSSTPVTFPANVACSLTVLDQTSATGGFHANITIWYIAD